MKREKLKPESQCGFLLGVVGLGVLLSVWPRSKSVGMQPSERVTTPSSTESPPCTSPSLRVGLFGTAALIGW